CRATQRAPQASSPSLRDALPIYGIAIVTGKAWFSVRKEQKSRGREQWIEGTRLAPGTRVLLVDDVISTGGSTLQAYERVTAAGSSEEHTSELQSRENLVCRLLLA